MVRLKNRWLIAQVDHAENLMNASTGSQLPPKADLPSRKQIFLTLSDAVVTNFGIARGRGLRDTQVQLCDNLSRLILIKVPREYAAMTRATLTLMTTLPMGDGGTSSIAVAISVVGVHGSMRTAKRSLVTKLRQAYRGYLLGRTARSTNLEDKHTQDICQNLQNVLRELHAIDF